MSMPKIEKPENPINREQSINNLIESVALVESGLSHIVNAEGEKIQRVVNSDEAIEDIIKVNESAEKMINSISKLEMILQSKLEASKELEESNCTQCQFLSSYIEALGESQIVLSNNDVIFNTLDNIGNNIEFSQSGTKFTIHKIGLYIVEWSINLASENLNKSEFCLLQNGIPTSSTANSALIGNFSSGALINVTSIPFELSLHNTNTNSSILEGGLNRNSAASMRIARFADGPTT